MGKQIFVLKFIDNDNIFSFEDKVSLVEDKKLIENLSRPNIKNQDSNLVINSLNDRHISDVIQIKVNVLDTGNFLISFDKESLDDEKRKIVIEEIGKLKGNESPTIESQTKKIQELLGILNNFEPIYATFSNSGDIKIDLEKLNEVELKFPLLVLVQPTKKYFIKFGTKKDKEISKKRDQAVNNKTKREYQPFPLFDIDYIFVLIFSLLGSFAILASVFELMNKEGIAAFLIILSVVFAVTLVFAVHSTLYKKCKVRNPYLRYYLGIFVIVGIASGIVAGYFICKSVLKTEIENFDYKKMLTISIPICIVTMLSSLASCSLFNIFMKIRQNKKSQVSDSSNDN